MNAIYKARRGLNRAPWPTIKVASGEELDGLALVGTRDIAEALAAAIVAAAAAGAPAGVEA